MGAVLGGSAARGTTRDLRSLPGEGGWPGEMASHRAAAAVRLDSPVRGHPADEQEAAPREQGLAS